MRAYRIAYDGRSFHGFQRQPDVPTVEDALFDALRALDLYSGVPDGYSAAGRTDAGASAAAQTIAFSAPDWLSPRALNADLPGSIRAWGVADVDSDFHATHDARRREYTYHLHAPNVDDDRADTAAARLSGEHDFHNLTPDDTGTVREISITLDRDGEYLVVTVSSGGFPRQLVRRLVSLVRAVGTDDVPVSRIERVLGREPIDGPEGIPPAPAYPLVLTAVEYDVSFAVDAAAARTAFRDRRVEDATRARVADTIISELDPS